MKKIILICTVLICSCGTGNEFANSSVEIDAGSDVLIETNQTDSETFDVQDLETSDTLPTEDAAVKDVAEDATEDIVEDVVEDTELDSDEIICSESIHCVQFEAPELTGCNRYPFDCQSTIVCTQGVEVVSSTTFNEAPFFSCTTIQYLGEDIFCCDESCAPIEDNSIFECIATNYEQHACYGCPPVAVEGILEEYLFMNCEMQNGCATTNFVNGNETWWGVCCNN